MVPGIMVSQCVWSTVVWETFLVKWEEKLDEQNPTKFSVRSNQSRHTKSYHFLEDIPYNIGRPGPVTSSWIFIETATLGTITPC